MFSTTLISEDKWCTRQSHNDLFVLAKSVFYFTVKAAFSFEALATKQATSFSVVHRHEGGGEGDRQGEDWKAAYLGLV